MAERLVQNYIQYGAQLSATKRIIYIKRLSCLYQRRISYFFHILNQLKNLFLLLRWQKLILINSIYYFEARSSGGHNVSLHVFCRYVTSTFYLILECFPITFRCFQWIIENKKLAFWVFTGGKCTYAKGQSFDIRRVGWWSHTTWQFHYNVITAAILDPSSWILTFFQNVRKPPKITEKYSKSITRAKKTNKVTTIAFKLHFINKNTTITNLGKHVCQNAVSMVTSISWHNTLPYQIIPR